MYDEEDDEFIDDPISLIYDDFPKDSVQNSSTIYDIDDDVEDDPIILVTNPYEKYLDTEIVDLRSSDDENEEQHPTPKSGYGNKNFVIPVTFLDFYRNVKLLKKCKPLSIKVVDCDKHPWYYSDHGTSKSMVNVNCLTLGKNTNIIKQEIKLEKDDVDVSVDNKEVNIEAVPTTNQSKDDKIQDPGKLNHTVIRVTYPRKEVPITEPRTLNATKLENELESAKKSKDLSQVDFKRNSGLVGLIISKKDLEPKPEKVVKKKTPQKRKKENIVGKSSTKQSGVALSNLGTSVTPVSAKSDNNVLNNLTKDSLTNNANVLDLSYKSFDIRDNVHNKTVSPTRCSLKITSTKILEKLKKNKVQDVPKTKSQQKAKKIFAKDQAVPKLSLKRRLTTENEEFYVINSNKEHRFNSPSQLSQSQEPQKGENAVDNMIQKKKQVASYAPITPCITDTITNNKPKNSLNTPVIAENLHQTQSWPTMPTPRSYHKKLKLKKSVSNTAPNKIIENETTTSECSKMPNNQAVNTSDSSLNQIVVSQVQSLRNLNTLTSNKPCYETPKNTAIYIAKSKKLKLNYTKDTVATSSNVNENVFEGGDAATYDNKVKNTPILQSPSVSYLQVYNAHVLNRYNNLQELSRKTKPKRTYSNQHNPDSIILRDTENNATEQNQTNFQKDIITATKNNINTTNHDIPNRDAVTTDANFNNTAIPPKTALHVHRFSGKQQLEGYFNVKQHHPSTQLNPTEANKFPPIKSQVYSLPGNNTVILRKTPPHVQASTHPSPGLPIQTVVNRRPVNTPTPTARFLSPWSFPPPNTNIASNLPCSMPNVNMYPGNQMYPQYYWQPTNVGNQFPSPLGFQPERNANLVPVRNKVLNGSIIGSTANGELIKKINIGVPASDSAVVNDKQKMLDTLNNAINDSIDKPSDPRTAKMRAKPCPLSKKAIINSESNIEPGKGYSPPILPIPSFQKAIELLKMKQIVHNALMSEAEKNNNVVNTNSKVNKYSYQREIDALKRKLPTIENKRQHKTKKISIEEYKKRVSKDGEANKGPKLKCKRKVSKNLMIDNSQDLGYDSDATMKL